MAKEVIDSQTFTFLGQTVSTEIWRDPTPESGRGMYRITSEYTPDVGGVQDVLKVRLNVISMKILLMPTELGPIEYMMERINPVTGENEAQPLRNGYVHNPNPDVANDRYNQFHALFTAPGLVRAALPEQGLFDVWHYCNGMWLDWGKRITGQPARIRNAETQAAEQPLLFTVAEADNFTGEMEAGTATVAVSDGMVAGSMTYQLNDGPEGTNNVFENLAAGEHTISVRNGVQTAVRRLVVS